MKVWRALFAAATIVNLTVGGAMIAAPSAVADRLSVSGPGAPYAMIMIGCMIAVFGVGYAIVTRDPPRNRGIVWLGVIGKLCVPALAIYEFNEGVIPQNMMLASMGDGVFALLFLVFLMRGPRRAA